MAIDEQSEVSFSITQRGVAMAANFVGQIQAQSTQLGSRDIRQGGVLQEVQLLHWTQANPINSNQQAARGTAGWAKVRLCLG